MRIQEILSIGAVFLSCSSAKQYVIQDVSVPEVNLGYERHIAVVNSTHKFYDFSNIRYGRDAGGKGRWMPPREPEKVDDPPLSDGAEKICMQAIGAWFPQAGGFIADWFNSSVKINNTNWIYPPKPNATWTAPANQSKAASEDCLFLDVKVPFDIWSKKDLPDFVPAPVMIWIHGGGYAFGWKHQAGNPIGIFEQASTRSGSEHENGVIFVAMNYRLGAFGWLAGSGIQRGGGSTNLGWQDQTLAMEWVQKNIGQFGGDPNLVTVFGESAGASSILHHLTAYGGQGPAPPFKRAILQSPAFFPQPEPTQQEAAYEALLTEAGVKDLAGLKGLNSTQLANASSWTIYKSNYGQFTFAPTVDFFINSVLPGQSLLGGHFFGEVEVMTAYNKMEGLLFTPPYIQDDVSFRDYIHSAFPAASADVITYIEELYPTPSYDDSNRGDEAKVRIDRLSKALGDAAVNCNAYYLQKAIRSFTSKKSYAYFFAKIPPIHGFDVLYTFYPEQKPTHIPFVDPEAAALLQRYLVNFAKTGNPNLPGRLLLPLFPEYGVGGKVIEFKPIGAQGGVDQINTTLCDWWQMAYYY